MAYPDEYTRLFDYSGYQNANPTRPLPGVRVNQDLDDLERVTGEIITTLQGITRSDGEIANGSVGLDQLSAGVLVGLEPPSQWAAVTDYTTNSTVFYLAVLYRANVDHLSTASFDPTKWEELADFSSNSTMSVAAFGAVSGQDCRAAFLLAAAFANAFNGTAGCAMRVPSGNYLNVDSVPVTDRVMWFGDGDSSHIYTSSPTAHTFNVTGGAATMRDMAITATVNKSAGAAIKINDGAGGLFDNISIAGVDGVNGFYDGFEVDGGDFWYITNCRVNNVLRYGAHVYGSNDLGTIFNTTVDGDVTLAGLKVTAGGDVIVIGCNFVGPDRGIWLVGTSSASLMQISQVGCDHNRVGIEIDGGVGGTSATKNYFTDVQATSCVEEGVKITGTGLVDDIEFTNLKAHDNGTGGTASGVSISNAAAVNVTLRGASIAGNRGAGVDIAAGVNKVTITDSKIGPVGEWTANGYGVRIASGTSTEILIADSDLSGNTTANLSNLATGTDIRIVNVKGVNPVLTPAQITVDQNNYSPLGIMSAEVVRVSSDAARNITGIAAPAYGKHLLLTSISGFNITLVAGSGSSTTTNRFAFNRDVVIPPNTSVRIFYDTTQARWVTAGFIGNPPTQQILTGSGTYTTPAGCKAIRRRIRGGGGGGAGTGAGAGDGGNGVDTTFGTLTAGGGTAGLMSGIGGTGGTASGGTRNRPGGDGHSAAAGVVNLAGGNGGGEGGGRGGYGGSLAGRAGATKTGGGGGGAGGTVAVGPAAGGGEGGLAEDLIASPAATYSYVIGTGGAAGAGANAGGPGADGEGVIDEFY